MKKLILLRYLFAVALTLSVVGSAEVAKAQSVSGEACEKTFWKVWQGDYRMEYYVDEFGNDVEVWCRRGFPRYQHYEVKISYLSEGVPEAAIAPFDPERKVVQEQHRTTGGCFFDSGENGGPDIYQTPGSPKKKFSRVTWTNTDPKTKKEYKFTYDWSSKILTITTTNGSQVTTKNVAPPESWEDLQKLLPDPAINGCTLVTPPNTLGFSDLPYTLTINTHDAITGLPVSGVDVDVINPTARWELAMSSSNEGIARFHLGRSDLIVRAKVRVLWFTITSSAIAVPLNGDQNLDLAVKTMGLPGDAINVVLVAVLIVTLVLIWIIRKRRSAK